MRFFRLLLPLLAVLLLSACASERYTPGWHIVDPTTTRGGQVFWYLVNGVWLTLSLSLWSLLAGVAIGLVAAILSRSDSRILRGGVRLYVELLRILPLFVILLWVYYALPIAIRSMPPEITGPLGLEALANISPFTAAVIGLSLNAGAFLTEVFRAGIEGVPRGHVEAARSLGMSRWHAMRYIILPQALRRTLPPSVNQFINTVKDSSLASVLGLAELTRRATELQTQTFRPLELYTFLALEYLVLLLLLTWTARVIERKVTVE